MYSLVAVAALLAGGAAQLTDSAAVSAGSDDLGEVSAERAEEPPVADAPLSGSQARLLELAFESVSAMPTVPHVKNRARAQEAVVTACLELDQPTRALAYAERIDNWRRGTCLAEYAYYCARLGAREQALARLAEAAAIAANPGDTSQQEWRADRIRAKVARTHWYLGQVREGLSAELGLEDSELHELAEIRAGNLSDEEIDDWMHSIDEALQAMSFDQSRSVIEVLSNLFERFYDDVELRDRIEGKMKTMWGNLPPQVSLERMMDLVGVALVHEDRPKALQLLEEALYILEGSRWRLEDRIQVQARLGALRARAGDAQRARLEVDAALAMYESDPTVIVNIYRADALRPVAEAYHTLGDDPAARKVYARALEAGIDNPNAWPRSVDLAETCCSMAVHGFEPDEELMGRVLELQAMLGEPW